MDLKHKSKYGKDGTLYSYAPRFWYKYWSRIKMKLKKDHIDYCQCYWCLKKKFKTNIKCPQCGKQELRKICYHANFGVHHKSGVIFYCKCGYKKGPRGSDL